MKVIILIASLLFITSCNTESKKEKISIPSALELTPIELKKLVVNKELEKWTYQIRKDVIDEVNQLSFDSISIDTLKHYINYFYYSNGIKVKAFGLTKDKLDTVSFYYQSPVSEFMAIGENCPTHNTDLIDAGSLHTYRGLKYKDKHIGLSSSLKCDNSTFEKGFYYKGHKVGIWKKINIKSNEVTEKDYEQSDSLEKLKQLTTVTVAQPNKFQKIDFK